MELPFEFLERMKNMFDTDSEYEQFLSEYDKERAPGLRVNTLKTTVDEFLKKSKFTLKAVDWCPTGFKYIHDERPGKHAWHEAGVYYIQEPSAMAPAELLNAQPGEKILDLCAAPGGKSTQTACKLGGEGLLVSNEIHPARAKILSQNIERMGIKNAVVTNETPQKLSERFIGFFDGIIVDAPCSGEGMFRKDIQSREQCSVDHVIMCAQRQIQILECAAKMLKSGGRIVYSTCTFSPEENEGVIDAFLKAHDDFTVEKCDISKLFSSGKTFGKYSDEVTKTVRLWPHIVEGEGHFAAVLRKNGEHYDTNTIISKKKNEKPKKQPKELDSYYAFVKENLSDTFNVKGQTVLFGDQVYIMPEGITNLDGIKVLRAGLHMGTLKKNRFEPSHALALALCADDVKLSFDFSSDKDEIYSYLKGNTLNAPSSEKGWCLITVDGYSVGWGKSDGETIKNHYPKGLRIV